MEYGFLSGLGLSASAGLNAYIPLLVLALADRLSDKVTLDRPYDFLSSTPGIVIILLLLTVETVVDKIPGIDHVNDLINSAIRPAAGAILMMAATNEGVSLNPALAMVIGLLVAGGIHAGKALSRPAITVSTGGIGNPVISMIEDAASAITAVVAVVLPLIVIAAIVAFGALLYWAYRRIRRLRFRAPPGSPTAPTLRR
ncbi:MAG: DUF4126 domain-containing protein [Thermomicrobiales bacterium]